MRRLLSDGWFQIFGATALLSLGVLAYDRSAPRPEPMIRLEPEPPASAAAPSAAPALPTAAPTPPQADAAEQRPSLESLIRTPAEERPASSAAGGSAPGAQESFPIFRIVPKTRGRWIVANLAGPDVDSPSIARAIYSAADGDVILLKPGLYLEPLEILGKNLTLRGLGARPEEVLVTSPNPAAVLKLDGASVRLENLRIEPERGYSATAAAVLVRSGRLRLLNVTARSQDVAILAAQGRESETSLDVDSSLLEGAYADLEVRGQARIALKNVRFTNPRQPIVVWRDTKVRIDSCRFAATPETRLYAYEESSVAVAGSPTAPPVSWRRSERDAGADKLRFPGGPAGAAALRPTRWLQDMLQLHKRRS